MNATNRCPEFLNGAEKTLSLELHRIRQRVFDMSEAEYAEASERMDEIKDALRPSWDARAAWHQARRMESMGF